MSSAILEYSHELNHDFAAAPLTPDARGLPLWSFVLIAVLSLAVYANSLKNSFALDDVAIVQTNQHVNDLDWTLIWSDNYWPKQDGVAPDILYRPLTVWSYLATRALVGPITQADPAAGVQGHDGAWAFHLGNIILHALVSVMATLLAWRILGHRPIAFMTGLLFALHPLHAEVVANVVGRAELLSTLFSFAALLVFLPTTPLLLEAVPQRRRAWHGILVALCFFLALLCKETPAAFIAVFPLIDVWRFFRLNRAHKGAPGKGASLSFPRFFLRQAVRYYLPVLAVFGIYLAMRFNACGMLRDPRGASPLVNPLVTASLSERIVTPFALLAKYLQLTFWPSVLSADYSFPSLLPIANPLSPLALVGILSASLAVIAMVRLRRTAPQVILTLGMFGCSYALVANVTPIGTILGERLFYLPSLFILMLVAMAAYGGYRALTQNKRPLFHFAVASGLLIAICVAMAVRTFVRNTDWQDNITLAIASARDNPRSAKSCFWAGNILVGTNAPPQWKSFGEELLHRSIELYPPYGEAYFELAKAQRRRENLPQSLIYLAHAAQFGPGRTEIRSGLDGIVPDLKAHAPETYMPQILAEAAAHPSEASPQLALGLAWLAQDKLPEAEKACAQALALDGHFHEAAAELAVVDLKEGKLEAAINLLLQYVSHVRSNAEARYSLVSALLELDFKRHTGALAKADFYLAEADRLSPGDPRTRSLRALILQKRAQAKAPAATPLVSAADAPGGGR